MYQEGRTTEQRVRYAGVKKGRRDHRGDHGEECVLQDDSERVCPKDQQLIKWDGRGRGAQVGEMGLQKKIQKQGPRGDECDDRSSKRVGEITIRSEKKKEDSGSNIEEGGVGIPP